ncbi:unnamed protein product [Mytilus edulis]|uniref:Uncharacterized protein n=1 Tax=Mytilus edulis TaxID=6550 RepID=A0A8S3RAN5_MYTED|nr:unnamed protein product [Mytilus edulis]
MAVFRKTEQWGWMALPVRYREHPLLNLDLQHFEMIDVPMLDNVDEYGPDYVVQHSSPAADLPMPSTASLKKQRSKIHDNRKQRVASKNLQAKKRVKPLPVARRKRKGSGRVGSTAEKIQGYIPTKELSSCSQQIKNRSVAFIPCATITSIFLEDIDSNDPFPSHGYLQQVNLDYYEVLIGAICESESHWCLMFAELILDDDENFKFDSTIRGIRALRHVIGQFLVENSESNEQASEESDISTVYEVYEVSSDNQSCCSKTSVNYGVEPLVGVASSEKLSLSSNWLYNAVFANTKITQRITSGMCGIMDDLPMTIQKALHQLMAKI